MTTPTPLERLVAWANDGECREFTVRYTREDACPWVITLAGSDQTWPVICCRPALTLEAVDHALRLAAEEQRK